MQIKCLTNRAAIDVLRLFLGAGLRPGAAFRVTGPQPPAPPIQFIIGVTPPTDLLEQLHAIPDVTFVGTDAV